MQALASALYFILIGACDYAMTIAQVISTIKSSSIEEAVSNTGTANGIPFSSAWGLPFQADESAAVRMRNLEEKVTRGLTKAGIDLGAVPGAGAMVGAGSSRADAEKLSKLQQRMKQLPEELQRIVKYAVGNITAAVEVRNGARVADKVRRWKERIWRIKEPRGRDIGEILGNR